MIALFAFSVGAALVHAQSSQDPLVTLAPDAPALSNAAVAPPQGTTSCFDYYRFGSVQAHLSASVSSAVSGTPLNFTGTVDNENPYPIVDGVLYANEISSRKEIGRAHV